MASPERNASDLYQDCFFFSIGYIAKLAMLCGIVMAGVGFMLYEFLTNWGFVGVFIGSVKMGLAIFLSSFFEPCPEEHEKFALAKEYMSWYQKHYGQARGTA